MCKLTYFTYLHISAAFFIFTLLIENCSLMMWPVIRFLSLHVTFRHLVSYKPLMYPPIWMWEDMGFYVNILKSLFPSCIMNELQLINGMT